jgi:hypothetical protein
METMARFIKFGATLALLLGCWPAVAQVELNPNREINANTELNVLLQTPRRAPIQWFASTDKTGGNDDFILLKPGERRRVPLVEGELVRLWSTAGEPKAIEMALETGPRRIVPVQSGNRALLGTIQGRSFTLYPTLRFDAVRELRRGAALRVVNTSNKPNKWYYQASVRPQVQGSLPLLPTAREVQRRLFKINLAPGEEKLVENWQTSGLIYEFSVAVSDGSAKGVFETLRLKADWEGQRAVDAPMMSLAGQVAGTELVQNAICDYDGARLLIRWPMPFQTAKLSLHNSGKTALKLDVMARVQEFDQVPSEYRFCAVERTATPQNGKPIEILKTSGEGAFAGLALSMAPTPDSPRRTFAYLEGDETIIADGQKFEGTGTEDYFSGAWYWAYSGGPYVRPFDGLTLLNQSPPSVAAYRFHINDAIPFKRSLDFQFEHGNGNNGSGIQWKWVAFWYQKPPFPSQLWASANPNVAESNGRSILPQILASWEF